MKIADLNGTFLHYREGGDAAGPPVVFSNSLGTDLRLWDHVVDRLPDTLRLIRYDMRGHGLSACPPAPYSMGALVTDAERLMDWLGVKAAVFVGLSIGGMVAQGLAAKRPDLLRAVVISNTAAKIGTREMWHDRIATVRSGGIAALSDTILERWFSREFRDRAELALWRAMLERQPSEGYIGCSAAIAGTDFMATTAELTLPTLAIAGSEDGSTPPDLVRETADLVQGSRFHLIRAAGHLPCVEKPDEYAQALVGFLREIGHV